VGLVFHPYPGWLACLRPGRRLDSPTTARQRMPAQRSAIDSWSAGEPTAACAVTTAPVAA
jgi:hypothetical protein